MTTYTPAQIASARRVYLALRECERQIAILPLTAEQLAPLSDAFDALHKALNKARRVNTNKMAWEQFLALIGETPVNSLDAPANPESGGGPKDDDDDQHAE